MLVREQALPWVHVAGRGDNARSGLGAAPARKEISNMGAAEPLVFDAIRTPRGRGRVNGSLHMFGNPALIAAVLAMSAPWSPSGPETNYDSSFVPQGPAAFLARARELATRYGERFEPPTSLCERAERGERYLDDVAVPA
jgi:hypothetical protein